ncbi:MAG: Gldg family protein [Pseudomonadota bacterium]
MPTIASVAGRIARKEFAGFFTSLTALIFIGVFLAVNLFTFFWAEKFFARNIADLRPLFSWMPILLIFFVAAITMRLWSEERRSGTLEFLMTSPAPPVAIALGKFAACRALVGLALALTIPLPITVSFLGPLDWGPVLGGYLATLCLAAAYIAIGLFVSARTDSQIVSLILTTLICGFFFILGSETLTGLFGSKGGELLRLVGAGSRFQSITRGVIDLRDLYYYLSIFGVFIVLNILSLERLRWSAGSSAKKAHNRALALTGLVAANLIAANFWLQNAPGVRADLTDGRIYSISRATRDVLRQLEEPLLLRGYFSAETHALLAPLAPRLQDLIREYEIAGAGRVRVEIIDPIEEPELEEEAGRRFGIRPAPFQTASRYQASVTNAYFDVVVQYGDEFETLSFRDLIEVKQTGGGADIEVELRNPEYDITRAIKKILTSYRSGGDIWAGLSEPVTLRAYVSPDDVLPDALRELSADLRNLIVDYKAAAGDKLDAQFIDPDMNGGVQAISLQTELGLQPYSAGLFDPTRFWFHLILESGGRQVQAALPEDLSLDGLQRQIESELKRFTPGALRTVALSTPPMTPGNPQFGLPPSGLQFNELRAALSEGADVRDADLSSGRAPEDADILFVVSPKELDEASVYAIDQFLMRGGSVVVATSAFQPQLTQEISVAPTRSGLEDWLAHHGVTVEGEMTLDLRNTPFPVPVTRNVGGFQVQEFLMLDYPHFANIETGALADGDAPTAGLPGLTMAWPSPLSVDETKIENRTFTELIRSSERSWRSSSTNVIPDFDRHPMFGFPPPEETAPSVLGVSLKGGFSSYFAGKDNPLIAAARTAAEANETAEAGEEIDGVETDQVFAATLEASPSTARLVVYGSASFMSDDALALAAGLEQAANPGALLLAANTVDWALEDPGLLQIRNRRGRFSRALAPMAPEGQAVWEWLNYGLAFILLLGVYIVQRVLRGSALNRKAAALTSAPEAAE